MSMFMMRLAGVKYHFSPPGSANNGESFQLTIDAGRKIVGGGIGGDPNQWQRQVTIDLKRITHEGEEASVIRRTVTATDSTEWEGDFAGHCLAHAWEIMHRVFNNHQHTSQQGLELIHPIENATLDELRALARTIGSMAMYGVVTTEQARVKRGENNL